MPVNRQSGSSSSVKVRFLDGPRVIDTLKSISKALLKRNPQILGIYLFGSLARGNYVPGSDADILIILNEDRRRFIDRIPEFLKAFLPASIAVDVFPYTKEELDVMKSGRNHFIITLWEEKVVLAEGKV